MKKIICFIFGHKYEIQIDAQDIYLPWRKCVRCGKDHPDDPYYFE